MAFVFTPSSRSLRVSGFTTSSVDTKPRRAAAVAGRVRMDSNSTDSDDPKPYGSAGKSQWKDNLFVGGFPGGESFFKKWVEEGLSGDVPDIPKAFQPSSEFKPKKAIKEGLLNALDKIEFFQGLEDLVSDIDDEDDEEEKEGSSQVKKSSTSGNAPKSYAVEVDEEDTPSGGLDSEVPDKSLYEKYFPDEYRNKAPEIIIDYNKNSRDRVGVAMTPVTASHTDLYYPKEMKNKAPIIDIYYTGSLKNAFVQVSFREVIPPSKLPDTPTKGSVVTTMKEGSGGGLKLDISIN